MMSSHGNHEEMDSGEDDMKPRVAAVRRNLFGPVDHQQLQQDFQRLLCMSMEVAKQRWNFDFQSERPASGAVEWEEMRCQDVPAFYRSCVVRPSSSKRRLEAPVSSDRGTAGIAEAQEEYLELRAKLEKRTSKPLAIKHRQATIPDFFTVKKRKYLHQKMSSRQ